MKGKVTREIKTNVYMKDGDFKYISPDDARTAFELVKDGFDLIETNHTTPWEISMDDFIKYGHAKE